MSTAASKISRARTAEAHIRLGSSRIDAAPELLRLVEEGWRVKQELDEIKDRLAAINRSIAAACLPLFDDSGVMHVVTPTVDCSVTRKERVDIANPEALRRILGRRFPDLVRERVAYAPERRLLALAEDADSSLSSGIRDCLTIRPAEPAITYRPL